MRQSNLAPILPHLKGMEQIVGLFGVSQRTVKKWIKAGAPIRWIGKRYQTNYGRLWDWLLENANPDAGKRKP